MAKAKGPKPTILSVATDALKEPKKVLEATVKAVGDLIASTSSDPETGAATSKRSLGPGRKKSVKKTSSRKAATRKSSVKKAVAKKTVATKKSAKKK